MAGISREMLPLLSDAVFLRNIMLRCENASVLYEADLLRKTITPVLYKPEKDWTKMILERQKEHRQNTRLSFHRLISPGTREETFPCDA